jgi:general secretion pathway protein K
MAITRPATTLAYARGSDPSRDRQGAVFAGRRGSALLTVLWISAALAAVAFALANTVRGETDRTSTAVDEVRSYYLAVGAVDRAAIELLWSAVYQGKRVIPKGSATVDYSFPTGVAHVELVPETAKLDVNSAPPLQLMRMMAALGIDPGQGEAIVQGIVNRRGGGAGAPAQPPIPSFPGSGASFQEIEELLSVSGVTPEIFYGAYLPVTWGAADGETRLAQRSGLVDCLSVFGSKSRVDANTADPAVLAAVGLTPDAINLLVQRRRQAPLNEASLVGLAALLGPGGQNLRVEGNSIIMVRATARVRLANGQLSDLKRTVAAQVKYMPAGFDSPIHILRWYDTTFSNTSFSNTTGSN